MEEEKVGGLLQGTAEQERRSRRRTTSRSLSKSLSRAAASWGVEMDPFGGVDRRSSRAADEDEEALRWAALEKLPTYDRLRTTIIKNYAASSRNHNQGVPLHKEVDVRKLGMDDKQQFIDKLFRVAEEDNERFLRKFRDRVDKYVHTYSRTYIFPYNILLVHNNTC